jgi:isoaspartyl peptidase/L-asparaginase-like protein (Ntn-hydrolase superfamily)
MFSLSIWQRGLGINAIAAELLKQRRGCLDAIEAALRASEDDASDHSTGRGGLPNAAGHVELDAAIMYGPTASAGAVGALRETRYAISVARRVMELTPHLLLVGEGAVAFARRNGFPEFALLTQEAHERWVEWQAGQEAAGGLDTMGTIAIDAEGAIGVGVTTSGTPFKLPGRVGDSAIVGAGLYCEQGVGGALATGVGEEAMRVCATFLVVELMRGGAEPRQACRAALERLVKVRPTVRERQLGLAALRMDGETGGASLKPGFAYAMFDGQENRLVDVDPLFAD